jgi:hypothetical protein
LEKEFAKVAKEREKKRKSKTTKETLPESKGQARDEAAKAMNVSGKSVSDAKLVKAKGTPEQVEAVTTGKAPVSTTAKAIRSGSKKVPVKKPKSTRAPAKKTKVKQSSENKGITYYDEPPEAGLNKMLNAVKDEGPLPSDEFWSRIGGVTNQRWFKEFVSITHYMALVENEEDGTVELAINESDKDLASAVKDRIDAMYKQANKGNRYCFDPSMYKRLCQRLYDVIQLAAGDTTDTTARVSVAPKLKPIPAAILKTCADGEFRSLEEIAAAAACTEPEAKKAITALKRDRQRHLVQQTNMTGGSDRHEKDRRYRMLTSSGKRINLELVMDKLEPHLQVIEKQGKTTSAAEYVPSALLSAAFRLRKELQELSTEEGRPTS